MQWQTHHTDTYAQFPVGMACRSLAVRRWMRNVYPMHWAELCICVFIRCLLFMHRRHIVCVPIPFTYRILLSPEFQRQHQSDNGDNGDDDGDDEDDRKKMRVNLCAADKLFGQTEQSRALLASYSLRLCVWEYDERKWIRLVSFVPFLFRMFCVLATEGCCLLHLDLSGRWTATAFALLMLVESKPLHSYTSITMWILYSPKLKFNFRSSANSLKFV